MAKIFVSPRLFWQRYEFSSLTSKVLNGKVFPILISLFFAFLLLGWSLNRIPGEGFLIVLLDSFVATLMFSLTYFLVSFIEHRLCRLYVNVDYSKSSMFLMESMLPFYLLYVVYALFPSLIFLWILILYSLYIMYFGALYYLKIQAEKIVLFMILSSLLMVSGIMVSITLDGVIMGLITG